MQLVGRSLTCIQEEEGDNGGGGCLTSRRSTEDLGSSGTGLQGFGVDQPLRIHPGHP